MDPNTSLHDAYVLHTRAYQESSLLVELLTKKGRLSVIAKGAKRPKSSFRGILQPFIPLSIRVVGRNELKTLTHAEVTQPHVLLEGDYVFAGFYVNELLMRLLLKEAPCDYLFTAYEDILSALRKQEDLWICLRIFEKTLLQILGYELNLSHDAHSGEVVDPGAQYIYWLEKGPMRWEAGTPIPAKSYIFSGKSLLDLAQNDLNDPLARKQAKKLLRQALDIYLGTRPLCTRDLFQ
jgi:DNA repair protein RecO (recombination protein O)